MPFYACKQTHRISANIISFTAQAVHLPSPGTPLATSHMWICLGQVNKWATSQRSQSIIYWGIENSAVVNGNENLFGNSGPRWRVAKIECWRIMRCKRTICPLLMMLAICLCLLGNWPQYSCSKVNIQCYDISAGSGPVQHAELHIRPNALGYTLEEAQLWAELCFSSSPYGVSEAGGIAWLFVGGRGAGVWQRFDDGVISSVCPVRLECIVTQCLEVGRYE